MKLPIVLKINGEEHELLVDATTTLQRALRYQLGMTGTKEGCTTGACGVCTVIVDGQAVYSCLMLAASAQGRDVLTIEGLGDAEHMHPLQRAFWEKGAVQCGYCIPGMIMAAKGFLDANPNPTDEQIRHGLSGNFCRCTGYVKIVQAVEEAARQLSGASAS